MGRMIVLATGLGPIIICWPIPARNFQRAIKQIWQ